ncbi:hypothetical protein DPX16_19375 [Anabarilius grahami]|uniref:Uncharacterized protein n=1 Tax=Anabarilius grahami TaxID=495550 RepID=A0A3N0YZX9_ANAGA|nr:hypothetical protein DPX16_19375 [Anabarilius grahami]
MNYTSLPPAGEICWLQAGEEYRDGRQAYVYRHIRTVTAASNQLILHGVDVNAGQGIKGWWHMLPGSLFACVEN